MQEMADEDRLITEALRAASRLPGHEAIKAKVACCRKYDLGLNPDLFDIVQQCCVCKNAVQSPTLCQRCGSTVYCSQGCRDRDWETGIPSSSDHYAHALPHKMTCDRSQHHMREAIRCDQAALQAFFPWLMLPSSASHFPRLMLLAAHGVLGAAKGYWSQPDTAAPHAVNELNRRGAQPPGAATSPRCSYSAALLRPTHLSDRDGWRLPVALTPALLQLEPEATPMPPLHPLSSWLDYYTWRRLPAASIASLLLEYPMTLYHLITVQPHLMQQSALTIHIVGASASAVLEPRPEPHQLDLP
mgnify:CR=1 FL=1